MDFDVAGVQSLAGGSTGGTPYSGKDGRKRWDKMKENVIKEWEEEQRKKNGQSASTSIPASQEARADSKSELEEEQEDKMKQEKKDPKESRMEKLKAKIFKH